MAIRFRCPHCGRAYRVASGKGGKQVRCKECKQTLIIPEAVPSLDPATDPSGDSPTPPLGDSQKGRRRPAWEFAPGIGDGDAIEQITRHIEQHVGRIAGVYHEFLSDLVHVDIHVVSPTQERPFHTLITSGMSELPMQAPAGAEGCRYAELLLSLPPDWPLSQEALTEERYYWPIRLLKMLARFPHEQATWLWYGHTIPNGDPPELFAPDTDLCCALLLAPALVPEEFLALDLAEEKTVWFFSLVPLYLEEMEFKLRRGTDALVERLARHGVTELLDIQRKSVCKKKRWPF